MRLFDTHAHLLDERFDADREAVIAALPGAGISAVVEACTTAEEIPAVLALTEMHGFFYGSAGVHPHSASSATPEALIAVERALSHEKIVAVGEIGLDYHYDFSPRDVQKQAFSDQIAIAKAAKKPIIVHDREAHGDTLALLQSERNGLTGVMHCFSGSYETACQSIDCGFLIAFGGALTFKNAARLLDVAARLPLDALLIETDCPYMTPEPHRGKRNDPRLIVHTLERLAKLRGMDPDEMAEITFRNAARLFGIAG